MCSSDLTEWAFLFYTGNLESLSQAPVESLEKLGMKRKVAVALLEKLSELSQNQKTEPGREEE